MFAGERIFHSGGIIHLEWRSRLGTEPVHLFFPKEEETASPLSEVFHVDWPNLLSFHGSQIHTQFSKHMPMSEITLNAGHAVKD